MILTSKEKMLRTPTCSVFEMFKLHQGGTFLKLLGLTPRSGRGARADGHGEQRARHVRRAGVKHQDTRMLRLPSVAALCALWAGAATAAPPVKIGYVPYVFETLGGSGRPVTDTDRRISEAMAAYWTNFAKRLDPNGDGLPVWPAFSDGQPVVMVFAGTPRTGPVPSENALRLLDGYFAWRRGPEGSATTLPPAEGVPRASTTTRWSSTASAWRPRLRAADLQAVNPQGDRGEVK